MIFILFLSVPAHALYRVTDFTGGCADCLDVIGGARLKAKTKPAYAIVTTTPEHATYPDKEFNYLWDSDAACAESVPDSIIPDNNASGGCWILLTPGQAADIVDDSVKDVSIDWGTGSEQVSAVDVPIADGGGLITGTEVETALQENRGLIDTNITDIGTNVTAIGLNTAAVATSAGLSGSLSDETGSGAAVFGTGATIGTPAISGGTINDNIIGGSTPAAGDFTTLGASGDLTVKGDPILDFVEGPITPFASPMAVSCAHDVGTPGTLSASTLYGYFVTYYTSTGETGTVNFDTSTTLAPSTIADTTGAGANDYACTVTNIPTSSNSDVVGRKLYRTPKTGGSYPYPVYLIATIADNSTAQYIDTGDADGALVTQQNTTGGLFQIADGSYLATFSEEITAFGLDAGTNMHAYDNTAFGYRACEGTVGATGKANVCMGSGAGQSLDTATSNVLIGSGVGISLATGSGQNVMVGSHTGELSVDGFGNIFIGNAVGPKSLDDRNIIIGTNAFALAEDSPQNTMAGFGAGASLVDNGFNSFFGYMSGSSATGNYNSFFGYESGQDITGDNNVMIGRGAGKSQTAISNMLMIHNADGADPLIGGDFSTARLYVNGTLIKNTEPVAEADGAVTISATDILKGQIEHNNTSGAVDATLAAASGLTSKIPFCNQYASVDFHYRNIGTQTVTLVQDGGATMVLDGDSTPTILAGNTKHFRAIVDDCDTPAVTIYSLGTSVH